MTAQEYQQEAKRTCPLLGSLEADLLHMKRGIITECAEILDLMKKLDAYGKQFTHETMKKELGDVIWYIANRCTFYNQPFTFDNFPAIEIDLRENVIDKICDMILQEIIIDDIDADSRINYLWYTLVEFLGYEVSEVLQININKLEARYPKGFTQHDAIHRNLQAEEAILNA